MSLQASSQPQLHIRINVLKATRLYWELGCSSVKSVWICSQHSHDYKYVFSTSL